MSKASAAVKKHSTYANFLQILVKNRHRFTFIAGVFKAFFIFFALIFFTLTHATILDFASFLPNISKVNERGCKLNDKKWRGSAQLSPLLPSPPPSEFCNDEANSVIRLAIDALRNSKKLPF
jgi:hypothetical protein